MGETHLTNEMILWHYKENIQNKFPIYVYILFFVLVCALFVPFKNSFTDFKNLKKVALSFCMWDSDLSMKADHHFLSVFALSQLAELTVPLKCLELQWLLKFHRHFAVITGQKLFWIGELEHPMRTGNSALKIQHLTEVLDS